MPTQARNLYSPTQVRDNANIGKKFIIFIRVFYYIWCLLLPFFSYLFYHVLLTTLRNVILPRFADYTQKRFSYHNSVLLLAPRFADYTQKRFSYHNSVLLLALTSNLSLPVHNYRCIYQKTHFLFKTLKLNSQHTPLKNGGQLFFRTRRQKQKFLFCFVPCLLTLLWKNYALLRMIFCSTP